MPQQKNNKACFSPQIIFSLLFTYLTTFHLNALSSTNRPLWVRALLTSIIKKKENISCLPLSPLDLIHKTCPKNRQWIDTKRTSIDSYGPNSYTKAVSSLLSSSIFLLGDTLSRLGDRRSFWWLFSGFVHHTSIYYIGFIRIHERDIALLHGSSWHWLYWTLYG